MAKPLAIDFLVKHLKNQMLLPNDDIIQQNTEGKEMHIVLMGSLQAIS